MVRRLFFQIHWLLGISAGLVLAVMGLTGATISFEHEITHALSPYVFAPGVPTTPDLSPDALIARLEQDNPGYFVARLDMMMDRSESHNVRLDRIEGHGRRDGQIDRANAAWLPEPVGGGFFETMEHVHRWLALPGGENGIGRQITGFSALALIYFALSGLYLRWPRKALDWRTWLVLDRRKTGRNLWRNLHVVVGTWAIPFYLFSACTGLWWSHDWYRRGLTYALTGASQAAAAPAAKPAALPLPRAAIDPPFAAFRRGEGKDYALVRVLRPSPFLPMRGIQFEARAADARHRRQVDRFFYDAATGALAKTEPYAARPTGAVIAQSMFEMHRGALIGLPMRVGLTLAALTMPLFTITGYLLFLSRRARKRAIAALPVSAMTPDDGPGDLLVVYASQTGHAELKARDAARALAAGGLRPRVLPLSQLTAAMLAEARRALFVVSTYGDGEPPDNARGFVRRLMSASLQLGSLHYGILALGDREYPRFCGFGHRLDNWLDGAGAVPLFPLVAMEVDDVDAEARWYLALRQLGARELAADPMARTFRSWTLIRRRPLNPGSLHAHAFHLQFRPQDGGDMAWEAGDIAEIQPRNAPNRVEALLAGVEEQGELLEDRTALCERLAGAILPAEEDGLPSTAGVTALRPLPTREYSIASIRADGTLDLVVRQMRSPDGMLGIGSGWLTAHMAVGSSVMVRLRSNPGFRTASDGRRLILIGNGTGIAGLRAHLRAQAQAGRPGHWLLFGEREKAHDAFFDDELRSWLGDGTLARLDRAFSRDGDCGRYVQHLLLDAGDTIRAWVDAGATILVCGSLEGMAQEVHAALARTIGPEALDALAEDGRYRRDVY